MFNVALLALLAITASDTARAEEQDEDRRCLEFVRADISGPAKAAVNVTGKTHLIRRKWRSPRGWDADVLISWPAPPARLCGGDEISFRFDVKSFMQYPKDPGGYAGTAFFDVAPSFRAGLTCTDSDRRQGGCGVNVMIPESSGWLIANATMKVPPREVGLEFPVFHVRLNLDASAYVNYIYRIVPRKASDTTRKHDLSRQTDPVTSSTENDEDGDDLSDEEERRLGTDPRDPDSDDDGKTDGQEVKDGTDPLVPSTGQDADEVGPAADPCRDLGPGTWIVIGSRSGPQGTPVRIPVNLCGADQLGDLNLTIDYAVDVLRATGFARGAMLRDALFDVNLEPSGTIRLGLADSQGLSGSGYLVYLEFDVIGAAGRSTQLRGRVTTATKADNDRTVTVQVQDGLFTVTSSRLPGDADGDNRITSLDALTALRMSIGKIPVDLILDVNSDGTVTALDARWILQAATGLRKL